jgi:predicted RNA-binding Zn ribbon-like protein
MALDAFILLGDALWLDFVNTARGRNAFPPDLLPDADAYAEWCRLQHLDGASDPTAFPQVIEFRERLGEVAEALNEGRQPPGGAIEALNDQLARSAGSQQLTRVGGEWRLRFAPARPLATLEAIARSAATTLADPTTTVRRCGAESCTLLFTDDLHTGSRRWCDASACGSNVWVERRRGLRG